MMISAQPAATAYIPSRNKFLNHSALLADDTPGLGKRMLIRVMNEPMPAASRTLSPEKKDRIKSMLRPGDILLETNNFYPGWQIAERVAFGSSWTHSAMYVGDGHVIDSGTKDYVAELDVDDFLSAFHIAVLRPRYQSAADADGAVKYCRQMLGRPYDYDFDQSNDNELYCAELIYNALQHQTTKMDIPMLKLRGKDVVAPNAFLQSPQIDLLWTSNSRFWRNMLTHWPVLMAGVSGAVVGSHVGGGLGALVGGVAATCGFVAIGNHVDPRIRHAQGWD